MIGASPTNLIEGCTHVGNIQLEVSGGEDHRHFVSEDSQGFRDFGKLCLELWVIYEVSLKLVVVSGDCTMVCLVLLLQWGGVVDRCPHRQSEDSDWWHWWGQFQVQFRFRFGFGFMCVWHQVVYSTYCNEITVRFSVLRSSDRGQ